ncbi:hypothetical protein [Mycobacterium sp. pW045]|uniref:hypothetical protein n=1 Tax=Mycobacterium sp. pW045 TaxID=3238984 RepID=UPI00351BE949
MKRLQRAKLVPAQALLVAGMAVTAIAGAPSIDASRVLVGPVLMSAESLQPLIDQVRAEMQAAYDTDSTLPFATAANNAMLSTGLQNSQFQQLMVLLGIQQSAGEFVFVTHTPEAVAGDAANSRPQFAWPNPDNFQSIVNLAPGATYELTGTVGAGTQNLAITSYSSTSFQAGAGLVLNDGLVVEPDGTFTVYIGPTAPTDAVNHIDAAGYDTLLVRDVLGRMALGPSVLDFQCVADCSTPMTDSALSGLSEAEIAWLLSSLASDIPKQNAIYMAIAAQSGNQLAANTMSPFASQGGVTGGIDTTYVSVGNFELQTDQALIVRVPDVASGYSGIQLESAFGQTLPYILSQTSLNNTQAYGAADGYSYYVISPTNPGVANWLDSSAVDSGEITARFQDLAAGVDPTGLAVTTRVVPVADVSKYLPADTPTVTPSEYAADMTSRVLSYNYALDTSRDADWLTLQSWLYDIRSAMGSDHYEAVFGVQPFTPMWLRLTPALSPDWGTVAKGFLANPSGTISALMNNLSLAGKDVELPMALTWSLMGKEITQTVQAMQDGLSTGDLSQVFTALESGGQQLGATLTDALFDPNISITAGILNARDDLATAVITANGGFPTEAGFLATLEWEVMSQLSQLSANSSPVDFSDAFNAVITAMGALLDA